MERRPESEPPNARLTTHQKWVVFLKQTYSPYTGISAGFDALIAQASGSYYSYGGGMQGFGKRYGASLANYESGAFFGNFLYPTLFHQDPRYIAARQGGVAYRAAHAASRVLVTTGDSGRSEFNYSFVLSAFTGSAITNAYYPRELRGFGNTMSRGGGTLLGEATTNLLREFWPDIRRHLRRHEPEKIRKLEQSPTVAKITQAMTGGPQTASCPAPPSPEQPSPSSQGSKSRGGFWTPGP